MDIAGASRLLGRTRSHFFPVEEQLSDLPVALLDKELLFFSHSPSLLSFSLEFVLSCWWCDPGVVVISKAALLSTLGETLRNPSLQKTSGHVEKCIELQNRIG